MSCTSPLFALRLGENPETGKDKIKFFKPKNFDSLTRVRESYGDLLVEIPCGHCNSCLLDRSRDWAARCCAESSLYENNCFVTLTFDDVHFFDNKLRKDDVKDFIKKLRNKFGDGIRYFACGEHGSENGRKHYHVILFNFDFPDKIKVGDQYESESLQALWSYGFTSLGSCTFESCCYVARYVSKKQGLGFGDEFLLMSTHPGIGFGYYSAHKNDIFKYKHLYLPFGSHKIEIPRYFYKLLEKDGFDVESKKVKNLDIFKSKNLLTHHLHNFDDAVDDLIYQRSIVDHKMRRLIRYV